jgi:N-acetylmuramoyl-L-alanine amidase
MPSFLTLLRGALAYAGLGVGFGCLLWLASVREEVPDSKVVWSEVLEDAGGRELAEHVEGMMDEGEEKVPEVVVERPPEPPPVVRERPLVLVDAGHGGGDGGAVWNGIIEKNLALTLALQLKEQLRQLGVDVVLTRSKDEFVSLEKRAQRAEELKVDALVSLHLNSAGDEAGVRGIETYYSTNKSLRAVRSMQVALKLPTTVGLIDRRGEKLAAAVQRLVVQSTGAVNRGTKERSYTVVHGAYCPSILVECGFISNPAEADRLKTRAYQVKLTSGIAKGVVAFLHGQELDPMRGIELPVAAETVPPQPGPILEQAEGKKGLVSKG